MDRSCNWWVKLTVSDQNSKDKYRDDHNSETAEHIKRHDEASAPCVQPNLIVRKLAFTLCKQGLDIAGVGVVGRRIWATNGCFFRGTSVLTLLGASGYEAGRHKRHKHTVVCWCSSEKNTLLRPGTQISRVTPLFSKLPSHVKLSESLASLGPASSVLRNAGSVNSDVGARRGFKADRELGGVYWWSSSLNERGLTSAAGLFDVSTGALRHLQSGEDLQRAENKNED